VRIPFKKFIEDIDWNCHDKKYWIDIFNKSGGNDVCSALRTASDPVFKFGDSSFPRVVWNKGEDGEYRASWCRTTNDLIRRIRYFKRTGHKQIKPTVENKNEKTCLV
jgi:hypothetical protein